MTQPKKAIVCVTNDLYTDQRVHKMCLFLKGKEYDVTLVGRKMKSSLDLPKREYNTHRMKLSFEKGALFYANFNVRLFFFLLFRKTDLIVSNDLDTLLASYLVKRLKRKTDIVYDTHELYCEVPELIHRPKIRKFWKRIERIIFPKLDKVITVNQSIADIYAKEYNKEIYVVRNISPKWTAKNILSKKELGIPEDKFLIIIQGAGINIDRGAEEAIEAMKFVDAVLMIVGSGDVIDQLKNRVQELQLEGKVIFYGRKPYDVMMNYTHYADIGLTLDKSTNKNYQFSLPNKVFDYIHSTTPIVATNVIEVAKVVQRNKVGLIVKDSSVEELTNTLNYLIESPDLLQEFKANCRTASLKENWEKESEILNRIYSGE